MENKLKLKQYLTISIVYAAIFAIYNIIVLLVFNNKNDIYWTSYAFMAAAFVANISVTLFSFKTLDVEAVFLGIPLLSFSIFYFFGELFISFVFMLFRGFANLKLAIAIQVIFLLVFIIFAAIAILSRDAVVGITKDVDTKVKTIKLLSVDVKLLEDQCTDKELKAELHKVAEAIKYSDPMTNPALADLDNMINGKVSELKYQCNNNNKNEAMQICFQLSAYIAERNQKLILLK